MRLACIGVGQAGGKLVDTFLKSDDENQSNIVKSSVALNTAKADLMGLDWVPEEKRVLYGKAEVKGHGVGADNELGTEVAQKDSDTIMNAISDIDNHEVDGFLLFAGLGGGTGSGGLPVIAKELQRLYEEPVYAVGILPSKDEGGIYTLNAARSFQTIVREVDNLILFDNDAWRRSGESVGEGYREMNEELIQRLSILFGAGEITEDGTVAQNVVDASEIINTLKSNGISTIGYASDQVDTKKSSGFMSSLLGRSTTTPDEGEAVNRVSSLTRKAALGQLTIPAELESAERALAIYAGPSEFLSRKGIERGRSWLEGETGSMEVRGGDYPIPNSSFVSACVLLSGVSQIPRIKELQQVAIEAQENIENLRESHDVALDSLVEEDTEELNPLL